MPQRDESGCGRRIAILSCSLEVRGPAGGRGAGQPDQARVALAKGGACELCDGPIPNRAITARVGKLGREDPLGIDARFEPYIRWNAALGQLGRIVAITEHQKVERRRGSGAVDVALLSRPLPFPKIRLKPLSFSSPERRGDEHAIGGGQVASAGGGAHQTSRQEREPADGNPVSQAADVFWHRDWVRNRRLGIRVIAR